MLLACLLAVAQPATAPAVPTAVGEAPARADAMALAKVLNPEGPTIEMLVRSFESTLRSTVKGSENYQALERDHPGISDAVVDAMLKVAKADAVADMPKLRQRYANFFASRFSPEETAEMMRFYSSPAGQRLVMAKFAKLDAGLAASGIAKNPEAAVSSGQIREMNRTAANSISNEMSAEDLAALAAFAQTPVFAKVTQARPAMEQLEADIANEADPELDAALEAAVMEVMTKFTGETPSGE